MNWTSFPNYEMVCQTRWIYFDLFYLIIYENYWEKIENKVFLLYKGKVNSVTILSVYLNLMKTYSLILIAIT